MTPTKCTIFIRYIYLLCFSYMFRYSSHHHQRELTRPLLKTDCCYTAIIYG